MMSNTPCDGCGTLQDVTNERGIIRMFMYCEPCARVVDEFLARRYALHDRLKADWDRELEALRNEVMRKHPSMSLPD